MKKSRVKLMLVMCVIVLVAMFMLISCAKEETYNVSLPADVVGGKVTISEPSGLVGDSVTLSIATDNGYQLEYLKLNGQDVSEDIVDNKYTFLISQENVFDVMFSAISYDITYYDDDNIIADLEPNTYTVEKTVILPIPTKIGWVFEGWYSNENLNGVAITQISPNASTGERTFYSKWSLATHTVAGHIVSDTILLNGVNESLYDIDFTKMQVTYTGVNNSVIQNSSVNSDGTYSIEIIPATYEVTFSHPYFECLESNLVELTENGISLDSVENVNLVVSIPKLTGTMKDVIENWSVADQAPFWNVENGVATTVDTRGVGLYFAGQLSNIFIIEANISNLVPKNAENGKDKKAGLMVTAYGANNRDWVILDQDENLVRLLDLNTWWSPTEKVAKSGLHLNDDIGNKLTIVRVESIAYVFVDDIFVTQINLSTADIGGFGFGILGGVAKYSNYYYSYNQNIIDNKIDSILTMPEEVENATLTVDKNDDIKIGDTITFSLEIEEGYEVESFVINGVNCEDLLVYNEETFVYEFAFVVKSNAVIVEVTTAEIIE